MIRSSVVALIATVSIGTLCSAPDAFARGGGHFGAGHFGGFGRDFHPDFRAPRADELRRPAEERRPDEERREEVAPREEAAHPREEEHPDAARRDGEEHRDADRHDLDQRGDDRRDLASHDRDFRHPIDNGHWDRWGHNAFWNDRWGARNFNCYGCRFGWAGGVFWPFAWGDMFSWAWWPYAGVPAFWGYGTGFILSSLFWPYGTYAWPDNSYGAYAYSDNGTNYAYARESHEEIYSGGPEIITQPPATSAAEMADTCAGVAPGVGAIPMSKIEETVQPNKQQMASFDALSAASAKAEAILKATCSNDPALTPVGRLDELQKRLGGMQKALDTVKGPLIAFTNELSPDQRERLDSMAQGQKPADADLCSDHDEQFTDVPAQQIEAAVKPDQKQQVALDALKTASTKASQLLKAACPSGTPESTAARLDAMSKRLAATSAAMNDVHPALVGFYDSLSDEQKARFNTLPQQASK